MGIYVVKLEAREQWAVLHSTSETMFAPTFFEELAAQIFTSLYDRTMPGFQLVLARFEESYQVTLAVDIISFLDEVAPKGKAGREIPPAWAAIADPQPTYWDPETDGAWIPSSMDEDDAATYIGDQRTDGRRALATHVAGLFLEWRRANRPVTI
jgi:hypothetical protein